jgi:hypothetical protein
MIMPMSQEEKIQQAKEEFGPEIVSVVVEMVAMADPDGAYSIFEDNSMWDHAEIVSMIYFEN